MLFEQKWKENIFQTWDILVNCPDILFWLDKGDLIGVVATVDKFF